MKKFYIIFLALPILAFTLLYLSVWWFIGGLGAVILFIVYRIFTTRLEAAESRAEVLENEMEDLHVQLEKAVVKEQKTAKEAEQVRQLKQHLLSMLSHEVRTPMNGVMGMTLLLADTPLTKEQQEYVNTIRNCGEGLLTTVNNMLVNDLLDFSKLQLEGKQLEYKDFDLRDSVEEVISMFADKTTKAGIELVADIDTNVPSQIIGDSKRLRQVLMNLVENAVKFTHHGEIFVGVQYAAHALGQPPELKFQVRDTGTGIAKEQLKQLFKGIPGKEMQTDSERNSGLGLVICRKLVELMGGTIEASSTPGEGSLFTFSIPMTTSLKIQRDHARISEMINLENKEVLIVDDNASTRNALVKQLKAWKMKPLVAESGKQALDMVTANEPDLVLVDMDMIGMDKLQLASSINKQCPDLHIAGMSVTGDLKYKQQPDLFSAMITKPLRQSILRDQLLDIFSTKSEGAQTDPRSIPDLFAAKYPLRILVAEDNTINQKIAVKILGRLGYNPALAINGKEVMEMAGIDHYDIILMDVQMPEMDGLEATRMIRTCLELQPVIIALTANAMQGDRDECMQAGMDDYMSKPIQMEELLSQLEKWALAIRERRKLSA